MSLRANQREADARRTFEALACPLQRDLYAFAYRLTGRREDAEDLAQDTLVRAYRGFATFRPGTKFKAWLFRIATNLYITTYHREGRRQASIPMDGRGEEALLHVLDDRTEFRPETALLSRVEADDLWDAVQALPDPFRLAVLLCDVEDLPYEEAASALGVPVGTIRSRLFRARRLLRERLQAEWRDS